MADRLTKCAACDGRGYFRCGCWPGDCICSFGDENCDECGGEGIIDESYDDDASYCDCSNYEADILEGSARCHRCGRTWALSKEEIAAEIEYQAAYMADEVEADPASSTASTPPHPPSQSTSPSMKGGEE
jgi:hypothetical protein